MTASPDARPEKAEDPTTESKATPEKRTATSKRASASSAAAKKASAPRTPAAKKASAARTPAKRPSTTKAAAEKAATGTDIVIEPVSAAGPIEKKVPARPAAGARATTTRTPAKSAAARTAAAKSAAAKKTTAASTTAAAKTTAAKTTAAKTAAAKSAAAKSTAAKTTAAKSTAAKTAAAKTAATKAQAAKSTARTAASRAASTRTTAAKTAAAKTAAAKAAAAQAAEVAEPKPQAPVTIESTRIDPPEAVVEVEETAGAGATVGVDEVLVEAETAEADVVEPEVVKAEVIEPEVVEPEVVEAEIAEAEIAEAEIAETETTEAGPEVEATDVRSEASAVAAESAAPAASDVEALHIRGLVKHFGDNRAVHGIDLSVPAGSFYGIVGPNGAGKTTTLSIIAGLLRADAGSVVICGIDQATNSQAAKRVMGVLPDRLRTFDRLTGRQLLYYYGLLRGLASDVIEKRVADLARAFDLGDALGRVVSDYSAGMTKKVMLAGAMIHSPRVLVLDEPFESVDPVSSAVILDILRAYVAHGGTVILSSHGMDLVERVCSRVAIIVDGEVLAEGTIDEVRAGQTLEARFVELSGGIGEVEGLEWLHTFSD
ncbi:ABC transporter ATP-binding protein [Microbacterium galbinum]|uniref:ABC transporter ATP-binding protein n=1 Tax=Microbacterium galbinum TaxID=2851646 RepID=UPI001FFDD86B|nr:ABC transporter ATP-binding protein [Microbacterium galbinum]